jgi:hypothetical protein
MQIRGIGKEIKVFQKMQIRGIGKEIEVFQNANKCKG